MRCLIVLALFVCAGCGPATNGPPKSAREKTTSPTEKATRPIRSMQESQKLMVGEWKHAGNEKDWVIKFSKAGDRHHFAGMDGSFGELTFSIGGDASKSAMQIRATYSIEGNDAVAIIVGIREIIESNKIANVPNWLDEMRQQYKGMTVEDAPLRNVNLSGLVVRPDLHFWVDEKELSLGDDKYDRK